eukprot:gene8479-9346_t
MSSAKDESVATEGGCPSVVAGLDSAVIEKKDTDGSSEKVNDIEKQQAISATEPLPSNPNWLQDGDIGALRNMLQQRTYLYRGFDIPVEFHNLAFTMKVDMERRIPTVLTMLSSMVCPRDQIMSYFENLGYTCPDHVDEADFLQELPTSEGKRYITSPNAPSTPAALAEAWQKSKLYQQMVSELSCGSQCNQPQNDAKMEKRSFKPDFFILSSQHRQDFYPLINTEIILSKYSAWPELPQTDAERILQAIPKQAEKASMIGICLDEVLIKHISVMLAFSAGLGIACTML